MESITLVGPTEFRGAARDRFKGDASAAIGRLSAGSVLVVDLSHTRQLDSPGIGALVTVRTEAAENRIAVRLVGIREELRLVLVLTKLDDRFELEPA